MLDLPEPKPTATAARQAQRDALIDQRADQFLAAINDATATRYRDDSPIPQYGTTPPVPQPGRPPMSSRATDASAMMIAGGFLSLCLGGAVSMVLYFSGKADPTVIVALCAGPPAGFLALKSLVKGAKSAVLPDVHNHHYNGPVRQDNRIANTKSVWNKTINKE